MPLRILLTLLIAACVLPAAAQAAPVASPGTATEVREHLGTIVFSQYDDATKQYTLMQRAPGQAPAPVPGVPTAERTFNADIGPDSAGNPAVVYERCENETCDLFIARLDGAGGERPIRNANDPERHDLAPTLWRGRIAWARVYGEQKDRKVIVYTKTLTTPRSTPSTRLPGVPTRRCGDFEATCGPTDGRTVENLELRGDALAQIVDYDCKGCAGISQTEVRLVGVARRTSQIVARQSTGMSGQSFVGPSLHGGTVSYYRACLGDPGGCASGYARPFRYEPTSRERTEGAPGPREVMGFADGGDRLYRVVGCSFETEAEYNRSCRIEEVPFG